ncbi:helix-turn-helix domain-containing protein [Pseudanabaena biceps]|nr:helix-turn-helix domain-containing protein [Pseudanabaena biceps]
MANRAEEYREKLKQLMQLANIPSLSALRDRTGLSRRAIEKLRSGYGSALKYTDLINLAQVLQIGVNQLITDFIEDIQPSNKSTNSIDSLPLLAPKSASELENLRQEYQYLQQKLANQKQELRSQFERETIQQLESLILQLPSAIYAAQNNPQMLAKNILPLLRPIDLLLQKWGIQAIGSVGAEVDYDPQQHQLMDGGECGDRVTVKYVGYRQGEKLLYRARVTTSSSKAL